MKTAINHILVFVIMLLINVSSAQCWIGVHTGAGFSIAQASDGRLWSTGQNNWGCLGNGSVAGAYYYGLVNEDTNWQQISAGYNHVIAIKADHSLWAWGSNQSGQLGFGGSMVYSNSPLRIGTDNDWAFVCAAYNLSMAIKTDGSLWGWGLSYGGLLGVPSYIDVNIPIRIGSTSDWESVYCGTAHIIAKKTDGSYWRWRAEDSSGLGVGNALGYNEPTEITNSEYWGKVSLGNGFTLLLKSDGTIWSTGFNMSGQLGDGSNVNKTDFVQIGNDSDWVDVCAGSDYSIAKKANGTLWVWGNNNNRQLGLGQDSENHFSPVQLNQDTNWGLFSASEFRHITALKSDGELWAWGSNSGEIGNGIFGPAESPQHIACPFLGNTRFEAINFSVFPNPTNHFLNIQNLTNQSIEEITVYDMTGKILKEEVINLTQINVQDLKQGLYFIQIQSQGKTYTQKFIKE